MKSTLTVLFFSLAVSTVPLLGQIDSTNKSERGREIVPSSKRHPEPSISSKELIALFPELKEFLQEGLDLELQDVEALAAASGGGGGAGGCVWPSTGNIGVEDLSLIHI